MAAMSSTPLRLGLSVMGSGSSAAQGAQVRRAMRIGYDFVHLIEPSRPNATGGGQLDTLGDSVIEAAYQLLVLGRRGRDLVAIGPLRCRAGDVAQQVAYVREKTDDLPEPLELAFNFLQVSIDDPADLTVVRQLLPGSSVAELRQLMTVLDGSASAAVSRIRCLHEEFGISFFTLHMSAGTSWNTLEAIATAVKRPTACVDEMPRDPTN